MASQVIKFYRKQRIKDLGEFNKHNMNKKEYIKVRKDYESKILNKDVWSSKKKLEKND